MSDTTTEQLARRSVLHHFAAVPWRAAGDKRLKARHFRVLGAVCRAVDAETGYALISQKKIAERANIARQNVAAPLDDLQAWGYLEKIRRGRRMSGQFRTLQYRVLYDPPSQTHDTHPDDAGHVTPAGDITVSPAGVAESDQPFSNLQREPERSQTAVPGGAPSEPAREPLSGKATKSRGNDCSQRKKRLSSDGPARPSGPPEWVAQTLRQVAEHKAATFEADLQRQAEKRISNALFKVFPGDGTSAALEAHTSEQYQRAVELEMRHKWHGANYLKQIIRQNLAQ